MKHKILVVDDEPFVRTTIAAVLKSGGYLVETANSGENALAVLGSSPDYQLILSDMNMPGMNGIELMNELKRSEIDIPIVILTGNSEISVAVEAMNNGADRYLLKDHNLHDSLLVSVEKTLEKHELKQKNRQLMEELAQKNDELQRIAFVDGLTQVPNRRYFDEFILSEWGRSIRAQSPVSIIMIDIDFFKLYNDNYGHQQGDECLKKVTKALNMALRRSSDFLARYGGEEFIAALPATDLSGAIIVAEKMYARVAELKIPHALSKIADHVTLCMGIACIIPQRVSKKEDLISAADQALYKSKRNGRNQTTIAEVN